MTTRTGGFLHNVVTLDPNKFAEKKQQCFHIGNHQSFKPFVSIKQPSPLLFYDVNNKKNTYPPDTKAFLYYSMSPAAENPRIAGELRLRVTSSNDARFFENGSDLLRPDGQIWSRSLFILSKFYHPLYEKLREDQLIPDDLDKVLAVFPSKKHLYSRSQLLYTLNDTFIVDFGKQWIPYVITEQGSMQRISFMLLFTDCRDNCKDEPYTGAYTSYRSLETPNQYILIILMNFRKCLGSIRTFNAPRTQRHKDRCVKLSQDNHSCEVCHSPLRWPHILSNGRRALPETSGWTQSPSVWSVNIDKSVGPESARLGLKLLWDAKFIRRRKIPRILDKESRHVPMLES